MKYTLDIRALCNKISEMFSQTWAIADRIFDLIVRSNSDQSYYEQLDCADHLASYANRIFTSMILLLDAADLSQTKELFVREFALYKGKLTEYTVDGDHDCIVSLPLNYMWCVFLDIKVMVEGDRLFKHEIIERIIRALPCWFHRNNFTPKSEADITHELIPLFKLCFPSTSTAPAFPHAIKNFLPDIGIPECEAIIECKYATSLQELKNELGELFEDIKGYSGSSGWKIFYAYIYQNGNYISEEEITCEFEGVPHWIPILVTGLGTRNKKAKPA